MSHDGTLTSYVFDAISLEEWVDKVQERGELRGREVSTSGSGTFAWATARRTCENTIVFSFFSDLVSISCNKLINLRILAELGGSPDSTDVCLARRSRISHSVQVLAVGSFKL